MKTSTVLTIFAVATLATALTGCVTAQERAAQVNAVQDATCRSWGLKPGTDGYANCRMELNRQAAADARAREAAYVASAWWNQPLPQTQTQNCTYYGPNIGGITGGTMSCR